ncbi:MAG: serine hydrolase [Saprospiraceae bacterium]|nr:serine hydrolase [Saprospiraceae bacterium]
MMRIPIICFFLSLCTFLVAQNIYFPPLTGDQWETTDPSELGWCLTGISNLDDFLEEKGTKAFIVLKNGKIVKETYFGTFTKDSIWYWASAGKTLTAFLTGMAQEKGLLDINDKTSKYLGQGWTSMSLTQEDKITVWHHLSMTTGMEDDVPDDNCMLPSCLQYKADAGTRWAYHNAPYRLIQDVIGKAWGASYQNFMNTQLYPKTGITGLWYDGVMYSKPRNMARFGLLMSNNGVWKDQKILSDQDYLSAMITPSQHLNKSYGLLWWLNGQESFMLPNSQIVFNNTLIPNAPADTWCGLGKNDQKIYIVPSQNIVIIRMGNDGGQVTGTLSSFDNLLWDKINKLNCSSSLLAESSENDFNLFPNPFDQLIHLHGKNAMEGLTYTMFNINGTMVASGDLEGVNTIDTYKHLKKGVYIFSIKNKNSKPIFSKKLVKN